jgi:prophage regulatory protein
MTPATTKHKAGVTMNILRYADACRKCGVNRMTLYRWATQPAYSHMNFPKPVTLGANSVGFVESEIDDWLAARAADRDAAPEGAAA